MHSNDSGRPLRQFLTYYRPHRRLFALDMLFALLSCAADLAFPYVSRQAMLRLLPLGLYRTCFAVMAALLVYCFRDALTAFDLSGGAKVVSAVVTALVYRLRHNTLLAVAAGTALCMALSALI